MLLLVANQIPADVVSRRLAKKNRTYFLSLEELLKLKQHTSDYYQLIIKNFNTVSFIHSQIYNPKHPQYHTQKRKQKLKNEQKKYLSGDQLKK